MPAQSQPRAARRAGARRLVRAALRSRERRRRPTMSDCAGAVRISRRLPIVVAVRRRWSNRLRTAASLDASVRLTGNDSAGVGASRTRARDHGRIRGRRRGVGVRAEPHCWDREKRRGGEGNDQRENAPHSNSNPLELPHPRRQEPEGWQQRVEACSSGRHPVSRITAGRIARFLLRPCFPCN
jgi:hypothetical protein